MILEKGMHVKCFMRTNAMVLEGIIEDWSDAQVILRSINDQSLMIIHRPSEDIAVTKVLPSEPPEVLEENVSPPITNPMQEKIRSKLQEVLQPGGDANLDKLNIKELHHLVQEQEKQIIAQKKKEHFGIPGNAKRTIQYGNPFLPKIKE